MKIMGRVAWLILLVVVSVCVVFCVLCCLQNNPVFSSVNTIFYFKKWKLWAAVATLLLSCCRRCQAACCGFQTARCDGAAIAVALLPSCQPQDVLFYVFGRWCHLSGRCAIIITSGKKVLVVCLAGARSLLRPDKKSSSCLSGGCAIVITTGAMYQIWM